MVLGYGFIPVNKHGDGYYGMIHLNQLLDTYEIKSPVLYNLNWNNKAEIIRDTTTILLRKETVGAIHLGKREFLQVTKTRLVKDVHNRPEHDKFSLYTVLYHEVTK